MQQKITDKHFFAGKRVLVWGPGINGGGLGTILFLLETEVREIIVVDSRTRESFVPTLSRLPEDERLTYHLGGEPQEADFLAVDVIIKNPSIRFDHPLLVKAREAGVWVTMDSAIFMSLCLVPVIGITGTKGKTTTASLIAHILEVAGKEVVRVGISQVGVLSELSKITPESMVVFEFSSWRLAPLRDIARSPHIAVITNLYPDHLNYYTDMEEYARDKAVITEFQNSQDTVIVPAQSMWTEMFLEKTQAKIQQFGIENKEDAWQDENALWCWWGSDNKEPTKILEKQESFLQGQHVFANMLSAILACKAFGLSPAEITQGLKTFRGVENRFELVREYQGVRYINDTTATIPSAALASVRSVVGSVILLAGGSDKQLPLEDLLQAIRESKETVLFAGTGTDKLLKALSEEQRQAIVVVQNMQEAVQVARQKASNGDTVLLAPGAASFGMFENEFDRGKQFVETVGKL